jgi:hypothetical protein
MYVSVCEMRWRQSVCRAFGMDIGQGRLADLVEATLPHAALGTHVCTHTFSTTLNTGYVLLWCLHWRRNSATLTSSTRLADRYDMSCNLSYNNGQVLHVL